MKDVYILAIESSCDETSCAIVKNGRTEIATVILSQIDIHASYGGVVPEIASRHHVQNITIVIEKCLEEANMTIDDITAIAVTEGPGLIGSLLVGIEAAKTLAYLFNKPLIPVHHIIGHIYANNLEKPLAFPLLALVVSGGHTELIYMDKHLSFKKLGSTLDDAVGECYDKVGRVLDLPYPGGPLIDQMAAMRKASYNLPLPLNDDSYNFSFSGLKSAVINLVHNEKAKGKMIDKEALASSFQNTVITIINKKVNRALDNYPVKNFIIAGGVAANQGLRGNLKALCEERKLNYTFPKLKYCTDNATMIAAAGYFLYQADKVGNLTLNGKSNINLA